MYLLAKFLFEPAEGREEKCRRKIIVSTSFVFFFLLQFLLIFRDIDKKNFCDVEFVYTRTLLTMHVLTRCNRLSIVFMYTAINV